MLKIALIPIDNRPVCYTLPEQICGFCNDVKLVLPPRELLGGLTTNAKSTQILQWLEGLENIDILVAALDTIAYGGLVASRRTTEETSKIYKRLEEFKNTILHKNIKTYACSSIMRISNNNINEEEKEYWNLWGKKIFDYSYNLHKSQKIASYDSNAKFSCIRQVIPTEILNDYFETRKRNFEINKLYLEWQKEGIFEYLVFSKDDCAQFGANVAEAEELQDLISQNSLNAIVKTGADEIPLSLLSRSYTYESSFAKSRRIKIFPQFLRPDETNLISKYEDVSVLKSVTGQIDLCGAEVCKTPDEADIILVVNNFKTEQGELVMGVDTECFNGKLDLPQKPYILADIAFANGSDNGFMGRFLENFDISNIENFLGYAGWNTTANTLGSALCAGIFKFLSSNIDENKFRLQQFVRFADDWAYQANCRAKLKELSPTPDEEKLAQLMTPYKDLINQKLALQLRAQYTFPWNRFFETEINI